MIHCTCMSYLLILMWGYQCAFRNPIYADRTQRQIQDLAKGGANLPKRAPGPGRPPQAVRARGPSEASDDQRANYELRGPTMSSEGPL